MTVLAVDAELAALRARVAALEELAKFFLRKSEGWGVSRNDPPGTPALPAAPGSHPTRGADSERPAVEDSSTPDPLARWLKGQQDKKKQADEEAQRRLAFDWPKCGFFRKPGPAPLDRVMDEWIRFQGDVQGAGR